MEYTRLFSPIRIGKGLELKNRIIMAAMHHMYTPDGYATDRLSAYYRRRAEGGAGLIIVGGVRFDDYGGVRSMICLQNDDYIPGYKTLTDDLHRLGAKVGAQLYHAGAYVSPDAIGGRTPLAPSAIYCRFSNSTPKEITKEEIREVIGSWAAAASRAREAGFDLVEIIASAGYLIPQFLSPLTNQRADEYGGSWENRTRFAREVVAAVRKAVGSDYPLSMRIGGNDLVPGSNSIENAVEFCKMMEADGIDLFNVTGGWHESRIPQLTGDLPRGGFAYLAAAVKDAVNIPVAASNRICDPDVAEKILALEQADLISLGRSFIADPDWPEKTRTGRSDEIRRCIACNQGCLSKMFFGKPIQCTVNGLAGREYQIAETPPVAMKNILVAGAGPAGCEFAICATERGNTVTLWEKAGRIGGQLHMAAVPPGKSEFRELIGYYETRLKKLGVSLTLNKTATAEEAAAAGFDVIVTATGVIPGSIPLDIPQSVRVASAYDILRRDVIAGRNVVIIGGGTVGCEAARYLAREASVTPEQFCYLLEYGVEPVDKVLGMRGVTRRRIAIVDIAKIGAGFEPGTGWPVLQDLRKLDVGMYSFSAIDKITADSVKITVSDTKGGESRSISLPCDTIVISVGAEPNNSLYNELLGMGAEVYNLGDSQKTGNVLDAVREANDLANSLLCSPRD